MKKWLYWWVIAGIITLALAITIVREVHTREHPRCNTVGVCIPRPNPAPEWV